MSREAASDQQEVERAESEKALSEVKLRETDSEEKTGFYSTYEQVGEEDAGSTVGNAADDGVGRPRVPFNTSATEEPSPNLTSSPVRAMRRVFLLLGLLFAVGLVALSIQRPEPQPQFVQRGLPEVAPPQGELLSLFEETRPASLQIEVRSGNVFSSAVQGVGTGFFISPDGLVLTAYHVVDPTNPGARNSRSRAIIGVGPDETRYPLELVGFDAYLDLALMKADVSGEVPYLPLAGMSTTIGSRVLAIGNSRGDFLEGRTGEVTRLDVAPLRSDFADTAIELTAPLAPGDSGGPVINLNGEAIGVVSYIALTGAPQSGFLGPFAEQAGRFSSFAIPVSAESDVIESLLAGERRDIPVIGFEMGAARYGLGREYNPRRSRRFDLGPRSGIIVNNVIPGGPADEAGLRSLQAEPITNDAGQVIDFDLQADVITAVDGRRTRDSYELIGILREKGVGAQVTVTVQRGDETVDLELELAPRAVTFGAQ